MTRFRPGLPSRKGVALYLSPWLMVGLAIILGLAVAVLAARNAQRERRHMSQNLMDRAEALIWALEAGARAGMGMNSGSRHLQSLLVETAKQPGIAYMALTDVEGRVLAHSDISKLGKMIQESDSAAMPVALEAQQWRHIATTQGSIFEVYKIFSSQPGLHHGMWLGNDINCADCGLGNIPLPPSMGSRVQLDASKVIIFVGLAAKPFEDALAEDFRNTLIVALLVGFLGFGGFVSLFWAQNYRLSRRLLQDAEAFAAEVVTNLPVGLLTSDPQGFITLANDAAAAMLGMPREMLEGATLRDKGGVDWGGATASLAKGRVVLETEGELTSASGKVTPISLSASRIVNEDGLFLGHLFILRDLGEVKQLQEQLRRNERLTALGNLAAGVAHEIRNPLSSIKGFATYLAGKIDNDGPAGEAARMMIQEVDRLNRVVSELLEFARPGNLKRKKEDINQVIERTLRLAGADAAAKHITVRFVPVPSLPRVPLDAERFTQALLNLFLNAIQATEPGGALDVSVAREVHSDCLAVRVADTGKGIPAEVLAGIFNPYFTTKPAGTGLGLAIVHRIVEGHGGEIRVKSQPGEGTQFTILLPLNLIAADMKDNTHGNTREDSAVGGR